MDSYDLIDRFLRNNLDDEDYANFSCALDAVYVGQQDDALTAAKTQIEDLQLRIRGLEAELKLPNGGEPEIRWVYRADGKAHIAGRPTADDAIEYIAGVLELLTAERTVLERERLVSDKLEKALEFYANGGHSVYLYGVLVDWKAERSRLEASGFSCVGEGYNGGETYIEDGTAASAALAEVAKLRE